MAKADSYYTDVWYPKVRAERSAAAFQAQGEKLVAQWLEEDGIQLDPESDWKPSFTEKPPAPYFDNEAQEFAFYLLELNGTLQESKLGVREVEQSNYEEASIWYAEVLKKLVSAPMKNPRMLEWARAHARSIFRDMV